MSIRTSTRLSAVVFAVVIVAAACRERTTPPTSPLNASSALPLAGKAKASGAITVTTQTTGASLDPDGYAVSVDGTPPNKAIATTGSVSFPNQDTRSHRVNLTGVAANGRVTSTGGGVQTASVTSGTTTIVTFVLTCVGTVSTGSVSVTTTTSGANPDPDGYTVSIDGNASAAQAIGVNGSVTFTALLPGAHTVTLAGLAANCTTSTNPQTISVAAESMASASFAVGCTAPTSATYTLVGAGDIAGCAYNGDEWTAQLLDGIVAADSNATVFTVGDNVYEAATAAELADCYGPTWGRHKARTYAVLGNHEYEANPGPTWDYFGARAGPRGLGYHSFDLGDSWHVIVLNDNPANTAVGVPGPGFASGSTQDQWLQADLAANKKPCTIAIWHQPYLASDWATSMSRKIFWDRLYAAGAEIVINGHVHLYERMAPQTPDQVRDDARGIREFIVGTGGAVTNAIPTMRLPNSEAIGDRNGVLKLTLSASSYTWEFVPTSGNTFSDRGTGSCH